ncbi:MAG TPA: TetR/AcrR family transcriptional regulator [Bacteroidales bacterium]|nr:TetR/AcrR family transcriptional regulator [Bacteroidales bacterium]HPT03012.1 TetR/AcrR family transcriptional regulator [Bacteroidales bacterium]
MTVREKIVSGANQLFLKYGIRAVTMDMIAQELGLSKRTIYENFSDKDALIRDCIDMAMKEKERHFDESIQNSENAIDALISMMKFTIQAINRINPLFFTDIQKYFAEINVSKIKSGENCMATEIVSILNKGVQEGLFRKELNMDLVARIFSAQSGVMKNQELYSTERYSKEEILQTLMLNFIRGIATDKGLTIVNQYTGNASV